MKIAKNFPCRFPRGKSGVASLAVGMMFFATPALAANELADPTNLTNMSQQNDQVTGRVVDQNGEPLVGVSVVEKGNKGNGAVTDLDGKFSLRVPSKATLIVSYVGYTSKEVAVDGRQQLQVTLAENAEMLNDVVVIGYGTVKKADLAGSVSVMDNKAFKDQPLTQASDALQGRVSGVNVVSDGIPGGSVKIRVRGTNSINKSNDPFMLSTAWCASRVSTASTPKTYRAYRYSRMPLPRPYTVAAVPTAW